MYILTVIARTLPSNSEHGLIGEAYVACWIDAETEADAERIAHELICKDDDWEIVETAETSTVTQSSYEPDDENLEYYEQALTDKTVLVFHLCPRYPVYFLSVAIAAKQGDPTPCEARIWIANDVISEDHDPLSADFWEGERIEIAKHIATQTIEDNDYRVVDFKEHYPCGAEEAGDEVRYYDDAEEDGVCAVIVQEGQA